MSDHPNSPPASATNWWLGAGKGEHMDRSTSRPGCAPAPQVVTFDALMPAAMAARCEESGVKKASMDTVTLLVLSVLAGAFISFGAIFATTVSAGGIAITAPGGEAAFSAGLPYGVVKLLTGVVFSVGPDPGHCWRRGALYRQQHDRDGLGERQGGDTRAAAQLDDRIRRQFHRCDLHRCPDVPHNAIHVRWRIGRAGGSCTLPMRKRPWNSSRP